MPRFNWILPAIVTATCAACAADHTADTLDVVKKGVADKKAMLVDVREENEWTSGHLKDATLLPLSELKAGVYSKTKLKEKLGDTKVLYLHCGSGKRCMTAADLLKKQGYDVRTAQGGIRRPGEGRLREGEVDRTRSSAGALMARLGSPAVRSKSPRAAFKACRSRSISDWVRTPSRRKIGSGGHHPWRACWRRNPPTTSGMSANRRSTSRARAAPATYQGRAFASSVRSVSIRSRVRGVARRWPSFRQRPRALTRASAWRWRRSLTDSAVFSGTRAVVVGSIGVPLRMTGLLQSSAQPACRGDRTRGEMTRRPSPCRPPTAHSSTARCRASSRRSRSW